MKIKQKSGRLFLLYIILLISLVNEIVNTSNNPNIHKIDTLVKNESSRKALNQNSFEQNVQKYKSHKKMQRLKNFNNEKSSVNKEINKQEINSNPSDGMVYISWFIFVPLILLIFIMTILSIAGFLILILNSSSVHNKHLNGHPITSASLNRENLCKNFTNKELLEILKFKKSMKRKGKNAPFRNYIQEPEPESAVLKN